MPFRSKEVLEAWLSEYDADGESVAGYAEVVVQDGSDGSDTGLIVIQLKNATTDVYMQPVALGDPHWEVTFTARERDLALDADGVLALSTELSSAARLCGFLERKSLEHVEAHPDQAHPAEAEAGAAGEAAPHHG
ncbi:hypothetical protein [Herbiconiux liangxiaofengii]|uniref:hypothetical protein n=1 Tax=Herbiconiux liangxiaofengii TaxID=3342795 RepID=UPI0035BB661E